MRGHAISEAIFESMNLIRIDIMGNRPYEYSHDATKIKCLDFFTNEFVRMLTEQTDRFQAICDLLADDLSRETYLADIKNRILRLYFSGFLADQLTNAGLYSAAEHRRDIIDYKTNPMAGHWSDFIANDVMIAIKGQYSIAGIFEIKPGDIVLDVGSYNGVTAIHFAHQAGPSGHVYSLEPVLEQFSEAEKNTAPYENITCVPLGLSNRVGVCRFSSQGAVSRIDDSGDKLVNIDTLDHFVSDRALQKIDLIKMDIEGGELKALYGSLQTINRFRPRLAICIYHNEGEDLLTIPLFIQQMDLNYGFYIRKYHMSWQETVLLALPK